MVLGWILFRTESLDLAGDFISRLADPGPATLLRPGRPGGRGRGDRLPAPAPAPLERLRVRLAAARRRRSASALALVVAIVGATVPSQGVPPFIYFQF